MLEQKEFTIKHDKHLFRIGKITPIELLALQTQIDFSSLEATKNLYTYILEHVEVKIAEQWTPVKQHGIEAYMPLKFEENVMALQEIVAYFLKDYMMPVFQKSNELK